MYLLVQRGELLGWTSGLLERAGERELHLPGVVAIEGAKSSGFTEERCGALHIAAMCGQVPGDQLKPAELASVLCEPACARACAAWSN
ncbi:MAG: hypothetical protein IPI49_12445 [Myxococcales bacterium]|nr:hypothetical protein [Myxococcales bacterium]